MRAAPLHGLLGAHTLPSPAWYTKKRNKRQRRRQQNNSAVSVSCLSWSTQPHLRSLGLQSDSAVLVDSFLGCVTVSRPLPPGRTPKPQGIRVQLSNICASNKWLTYMDSHPSPIRKIRSSVGEGLIKAEEKTARRDSAAHASARRGQRPAHRAETEPGKTKGAGKPQAQRPSGQQSARDSGDTDGGLYPKFPGTWSLLLLLH